MSASTALLVTAAGVAALAALLYGVRRASRRRQVGDPLGAFLRHFERRGVPPELAHAAYDALRGWRAAAEGGARVTPQDDLQQVYGVAPEERREAVALVARACGRELPPELPLPEELETVDTLVRFVAGCPPRSAP